MQRKNSSKTYLPIGLLAAIILLIFFNSIGWLEWPKGVMYRIFSPVAKPFIFTGVKISDTAKVILGLKDLVKENTQLRQENQEFVLKLAELSEVAQENKFLQDQLQLKPPLKSRLVEADLIGFDPGNLGSIFFINRGKKDGVSENQGAIFAGGFLVGKVSEAKDNLSKVIGLNDSNSSVFAITQETRTSGVVKGDHGVGLVLDMVPPESEIKPGELVLSSGLDGFLPKGLVIGWTENKISQESEIFQRFKIKPAINYTEIERVFIVLGNE